MEKNNIKKALIFIIITFFILVSLPIISSEFVEYPLEDGPYTVIMIGKTYDGSVSKPFFWNPEIGLQLGPFCKYKYPYGPGYNMLNGSIFIVKGKIQKYEYPAQIGLKGFIGFAPAINHLTLKILSGGKIRILGTCDVIYLWYGL